MITGAVGDPGTGAHVPLAGAEAGGVGHRQFHGGTEGEPGPAAPADAPGEPQHRVADGDRVSLRGGRRDLHHPVREGRYLGAGSHSTTTTAVARLAGVGHRAAGRPAGGEVTDRAARHQGAVLEVEGKAAPERHVPQLHAEPGRYRPGRGALLEQVGAGRDAGTRLEPKPLGRERSGGQQQRPQQPLVHGLPMVFRSASWARSRSRSMSCSRSRS